MNEQLKLYAELVGLEKTKRKSAISPLFIKKNRVASGRQLDITLVNNRKMAHNVELKEIQNDRLIIGDFPKLNYVRTDEIISIKLMKKDSNDPTEIASIPFEIDLCYENEDRDKFKQRIYFRAGKGYNIDRQEEII